MRWRYSLLIVVLIVVAIVIAYLYISGLQQHELAIVEIIMRVGGQLDCGSSVEFTTQVGFTTHALTVAKKTRKWLPFGTKQRVVCSVDLSNCVISNADSDVLRTHHNCVVLSLRNSRLSHSAALDLLSNSSLEVVDLRGVLVDRSIHEALKRLDDLRLVIVDKGMIDDDVLNELCIDMKESVIVSDEKSD